MVALAARVPCLLSSLGHLGACAAKRKRKTRRSQQGARAGALGQTVGAQVARVGLCRARAASARPREWRAHSRIGGVAPLLHRWPASKLRFYYPCRRPNAGPGCGARAGARNRLRLPGSHAWSYLAGRPFVLSAARSTRPQGARRAPNRTNWALVCVQLATRIESKIILVAPSEGGGPIEAHKSQ